MVQRKKPFSFSFLHNPLQFLKRLFESLQTLHSFMDKRIDTVCYFPFQEERTGEVLKTKQVLVLQTKGSFPLTLCWGNYSGAKESETAETHSKGQTRLEGEEHL